MKTHSKNILNEIDYFFDQPLTANQKAWGIINEFYHLILTHMEEQNITRAGLAKKLGKSRSAISQMFNKTPNITVRKMVEISDSIGLDFDIVPSYVKKEFGKKVEKEYIIINIRNAYLSQKINNKPMIKITEDENYQRMPCIGAIVRKSYEFGLQGKSKW